jgi:regulator of CtrA degradation
VIKLQTGPARFGHNFVHSEAFRALFQEGMELVEETAAYLDGPGREQSRTLPRTITIAYASESMRLTTRLMQIASWLLVQRAVADGEMTPVQGQAERARVRLASVEATATIAEFEALPKRLRELVGLTARLHARIMHLEQIMAEAEDVAPAAMPNPVAIQRHLLERAFGMGRDHAAL